MCGRHSRGPRSSHISRSNGNFCRRRGHRREAWNVTAARKLLPPPQPVPPLPTRERLRGRRASRLAPLGRRLCFKSRLSARHAANHDAWHVRARAITERVDRAPPLSCICAHSCSPCPPAHRGARFGSALAVSSGASPASSSLASPGWTRASVRVRHVLSPAWPGPRLPFLLLPPFGPRRTTVERFTAACAFQNRTADQTNERTNGASERLPALTSSPLFCQRRSWPSRPGWCCRPPHRDPAAGDTPGLHFPAIAIASSGRDTHASSPFAHVFHRL